MKLFGWEVRKAAPNSALIQAGKSTEIRFINGMTIIYDQNTTAYLRDGFLSNSVVYSIVNIIATKFSSIPWYVYSKKNNAKLKAYEAATSTFNRNVLQSIKLKGSALKEVEGTDLNRLLEQPNNVDTWSDLLYEAIGYRKITGAGTLRIMRSDNDGRLLGLENLPSHDIQIVGDGTLNGIKSYFLRTIPAYEFPAEDVMYWKYKNFDFNVNGQHLYGLSPIRSAVRDISANNFGKDAVNAMFKNGGAVGIISNEEPGALSPEQQALLKDKLDEFINSRSQKGKTVPINAKVKWQQVGMNAVDMNLMEALKLSKEDIVNIFNFPINLLSDERATENNKEQALKYLVTNTIYPDLVSFRDQFNKQVAPLIDKDLYIDFDISMLPELQDDMEKLANVLDKAYYLTPNEKRVALRYDELADPNMNTILVPSGLQSLDDATMKINPDLGNPDLSDYTPQA
jgi:HK97 family phage portal protein